MSAIPRYEFRPRIGSVRKDAAPKQVTLTIEPWPRSDGQPARWTVGVIPCTPPEKRYRERTSVIESHIVTARPGGLHTCSCDASDEFTPCVHVLGVRRGR